MLTVMKRIGDGDFMSIMFFFYKEHRLLKIPFVVWIVSSFAFILFRSTHIQYLSLFLRPFSHLIGELKMEGNKKQQEPHSTN
jgi:hypothetical protein